MTITQSLRNIESRALKQSPGKRSPGKKGAAKKATPKKATPKKATPKKATPKKAAIKKITPELVVKGKKGTSPVKLSPTRIQFLMKSKASELNHLQKQFRNLLKRNLLNGEDKVLDVSNFPTSSSIIARPKTANSKKVGPSAIPLVSNNTASLKAALKELGTGFKKFSPRRKSGSYGLLPTPPTAPMVAVVEEIFEMPLPPKPGSGSKSKSGSGSIKPIIPADLSAPVRPKTLGSAELNKLTPEDKKAVIDLAEGKISADEFEKRTAGSKSSTSTVLNNARPERVMRPMGTERIVRPERPMGGVRPMGTERSVSSLNLDDDEQFQRTIRNYQQSTNSISPLSPSKTRSASMRTNIL